MRPILLSLPLAALCISALSPLRANTIESDLFSLEVDVAKTTADLISGDFRILQDDLWDISEHLHQATQTLKQYSTRTIPDAEAAPICMGFTSLGLVPSIHALQSYGPGTPLCLPVSAVKLAFEHYGGEFIARLDLKDKWICQGAVQVAREVVLVLDDAVHLLCDH